MRFMPENQASGSLPGDWFSGDFSRVSPKSQNKLLRELGVSFDVRGNVVKDADHMTSVPGVFAAGDLARGASLVVRAIQDGRETAESVHRWLTRSK